MSLRRKAVAQQLLSAKAVLGSPFLRSGLSFCSLSETTELYKRAGVRTRDFSPSFTSPRHHPPRHSTLSSSMSRPVDPSAVPELQSQADVLGALGIKCLSHLLPLLSKALA